MKIAIVYPSFGVVAVTNQPNIKAVADNYGIYPNISLAYVAGALKKAGHDVIFLDAMASSLSLDDMVARLKRFSPDILMFSLMTYLVHETLDIIRFFRKHIDAEVIVGGAYVGLYPNETIKNKEIDIGIIGEAEETVPELMLAIKNKSALRNIKGICFREKGRIVITQARAKISDLDTVAFPSRDLLPMNKYYSFISRYRNYTIMITSRGCTFQCSFCEQRTGDIRYRSPKNVVEEMNECQNKYNVREIDFFDPLFTINKKRVIEICDEITKKKLKIKWSCRSRVDTIDEEMLMKMRKAGCYRIYFGIESGDEQILKNLKKFTKISQIKNAISLSKKHGILAFGYFILGSPGETIQSMKNTIKLSLELPLDYAQFNRMSYLPGTGIYDEIVSNTGFDYWSIYASSKNNEKQMPQYATELKLETINMYVKMAYKKFYFRPKMVIRFLKNIKSGQELFRYTKAGVDMIIKN